MQQIALMSRSEPPRSHAVSDLQNMLSAFQSPTVHSGEGITKHQIWESSDSSQPDTALNDNTRSWRDIRLDFAGAASIACRDEGESASTALTGTPAGLLVVGEP